MKRKAIGRLKEVGVNVRRYITSDLLSIDPEGLPKTKAQGIYALKIMVLSIQKFLADQCLLRASALTFYSLLSIVPVVALAFGIAKGFGLEKRLEQDLYLHFSGQQEVLNFVIEFARSLLENTKGGLVAGIGVLTLLLSVVKVLNHIENAFNLIWGVKSRTFDRKFSDYLAIMLTGPILFTLASSMTLFIKTQVESFAANTAILNLVSPLIYLGLKLLPYLLIWILFTIVYVIMPNTRVPAGSAFLAGMMAGTLYQISQVTYINLQILVADYNAIYGSFAALPLFLIWLNVSWLILLFGAEISNTCQNTNSYDGVAIAEKIPFIHQKTAALLIVHLLVKRFEAGKSPATAKDISHELRLPIRIVHEITEKLSQTNLISFTILSDKNSLGLQPARDIHTLSIQTVISGLDQYGDTAFNLPESEFKNKIRELLDTLAGENQTSNANCLLKDL